MKQKELERKEVLLEREIALLAERLEKIESEVRDRLHAQDLKIRALELYVGAVHPNTSGMFHDIESRVFDTRPPIA